MKKLDPRSFTPSDFVTYRLELRGIRSQVMKRLIVEGGKSYRYAKAQALGYIK